MHITLRKLNHFGFDHTVLSIAAFILVGVAGTALIVESHASTIASKGFLEAFSNNSGYCLSDNGTTNGSKAVLDGCYAGSITQSWIRNDVRTATVLGIPNVTEFTLQSVAGASECLNDPYGSKTNGTALQLYTCHDSDNNSLWVWGGNLIGKGLSKHQLINVGSIQRSSGLCLDDAYGAKTNGTKVQLYRCKNTPQTNQSWFEDASPGGIVSSSCTNPAFQTSQTMGSWNYSGSVSVNNNVWGPIGSWSQELKACSPSNWSVLANFQNNGGAIQTYPDTKFSVSGKSIAQYNSLETCFGDTPPTGGLWDYAADDWINNYTIEIMVWNNWNDLGSSYPPSGSRAETIDGVAYHEFKGGGSNEWIYTRDKQVTSGCYNALDLFKDLVAHPSSSGITSSSVPNAIEYGVEIGATNGSETFRITNATLTAK